jgi:hypothetical protein
VTTVEASCPETLKDVPVATPMTGVTRVGEVFMTNVLPVPVWDAIDVAFPTEVMGPVRFAFALVLSARIALAAYRFGT